MESWGKKEPLTLQWFQGTVFVENASLTFGLRFVLLKVFFRADPRNHELFAKDGGMLWSSRPPGGWVSAELGSCKKQRCCVLSGYIVSNCRATPWTIATRLLCPRDSPGKNTGVSCHFLLRGLFLTQGSNPCLLYLLHWQMDSLPLRHLGSPEHKSQWAC